MNASLIRIAAVLIAVSTLAEAQAQQPMAVTPQHRVLHNISPGYLSYPAYGFYPRAIFAPSAATVGESWARGRAAVTYAQAHYNLTMARVRAIDTETRQRQVGYYYDNKQTNRQYRESVRKERPTAEDLTRFAQVAKPDELSPSELNDGTGEISWPELLQSDRFAAYRAELEGLFARVAAEGQFDARTHEQLHQTTDAMQAALAALVREVEPMDYVEAKRFLESLAFQSRQHES